MAPRLAWAALVLVAACSETNSATSAATGEETTAGGTVTGASASTTEDSVTGESDAVEPCIGFPCRLGTVGCPCVEGECSDGAACEAGTCVAANGDTVRVPAGAFCMGCDAAEDDGCVSDELPLHRVELPEFHVDRYEVTQSQYRECIDAGVCPIPDDGDTCSGKYDPVLFADHPITCVDWGAAAAYCGFVGKRLPSEAEWEKAARGVQPRTWPWGNVPADCERANFSPLDQDCVGSTTPGGSHPTGVSPFGALDMAGNVWEWTADWYGPDWYESSPVDSPTGPELGSARVLRGGSFTSFAKFLRTAARDGARAPSVTARNIGFRCVQ